MSVEWVKTSDRLPTTENKYWVLLDGVPMILDFYIDPFGDDEGVWWNEDTETVKHPSHWAEIVPPQAPQDK